MSTYRERMEAYASHAALLASQDNTPTLRQAACWIKEADKIVVGGAAGLSAAGGMDYMSHETLEQVFPQLAKKGYDHFWKALWDPERTEEQKWAMLAAEALWARFDYPVISAYTHLLRILQNKDYFVLTSNIDGQFIKAGFDPQRVFEPQGSIALLQCSRPCCDTLWDGEPFYRQIARDIDPVSFSCPTEDIPHCPHCGAPLVQNLRGPDCFIPRETMKNRQPFEDFMKEAEHSSTLFLELGVGFNSPGLIRHYFQRLTWLWPNARLIRFNRDYPSTPKKLGERALPVGGDLKENLLKLDRFCQEEQ